MPITCDLICQPEPARFGDLLLKALARPSSKRLEYAVAWVRRSGAKLLAPALEDFLRHGGSIRGVVGVDLDNTSYEGLDDLLALENAGDCETYVWNNENSAVTFHPKLYLILANRTATLFAGSSKDRKSVV